MLFSSFEFLSLLPPGVALYWLLRRPIPQRLFVMAVSALFLAYPGLFHLWVFAAIVAAAAAVIAIANQAGAHRRAVLATGVSALIATLAYFKVQPPHPLGISYYSFILIGFLLEAAGPARVSPGTLVSSITFFPMLLSGPIVRWRAWSSQFGRRPKRGAMRHVTIGAQLFAVGALKKILVADAIAVSTAPVWARPADFTALAVSMALFAFYLQVYADFSGYTDMARGVARMLGFRLPINFKGPYLAATPLEFWGRWHISLTSWIRDYAFTPLSMVIMRRVRSRRLAPAVTFLLVVFLMVVVGLWHGVSVNFIAFGLVHGIMIGSWYALVGTGRKLTPLSKTASAMLFQVLLMVSMVLFRADSPAAAGAMLTAAAGSSGTATLSEASVGMALAAVIVFALQSIEWRAGRSGVGRAIATARSHPRWFPVFVIATFGIYYFKGLTLEGVWIPSADPFFNEGLEKFIYFEF